MAEEMSTTKEVLEPIEASELLQNLKLSTGKAAQFAGVSRRQLCYWTDTGIVTSIEGEELEEEEGGDDPNRRTYDFDALHKVLLIKQSLEGNAGLRRAAKDIDKHLVERRRLAQGLLESIEQKREEFLTDQAEKLQLVIDQTRRLSAAGPNRERLLEVYHALDWLDRMADQVQNGKLLLEEDADACLKLASIIEQAEARLSSMNQAELRRTSS
jgi:DNA-binding transcriptional MerR regulator